MKFKKFLTGGPFEFLFVDYSHRNSPIIQVGYSEALNNIREMESKPKVKTNVEWDVIAANKLGADNTMDNVRNWQEKLREAKLYFGEIDGKWGTSTEKAYNAYVAQNPAQTLVETPVVVAKKPDDTPKAKQHWTDRFKKNNQGALTWNWKTPTLGNKTYTYAGKEYDVRKSPDGKVYYIDRVNGKMKLARPGIARLGGETSETWGATPWEDIIDGVFLKDGGTINKYLQEGRMNNQEEIQKAFMAYLIEDAADQGVKILSELDLQAYAQLLGEEGLKAKYQEFMLKMQGGVKAKFGAKLDYVRKLKGLCPEGEELVYLQKGGHICQVCLRKAEKAKPGTKVELNEVAKFKNRRISPSDTVWVDGDKKKARTLTDDRGKAIVPGLKPYSAAEYQKDMAKGKKGDKAAARRVEKQNEKTMYGCGAKLKKKK